MGLELGYDIGEFVVEELLQPVELGGGSSSGEGGSDSDSAGEGGDSETTGDGPDDGGTGSESGESSSGSGSEQDDESSGCACKAAPRPAPLGLFMLVAPAFVRRRKVA